MTNTINWNTIVSRMDANDVRDFAKGLLSGRQFYETALCQFNGVSAEVRNLLRNRGVDEARQLARKALRRRGVNV